MAIYRIPVTLTWPGSGSPGVNVFHLRTTDPILDVGTDLILDEALDHLETWYQYVTGNLLVQGTKVSMGTSILNVETNEAFDAPERTYTNTGATDKAPPALAVVVGWRTSSATRRGRGRTFLGPLAANVMAADGTPHDTILTGLRTATQTFVDASQAIAGGAYGVWGQENAGVPGLNVIRDITSFKVRDTFAVLRSRRD
jgi:hypothetical protein